MRLLVLNQPVPATTAYDPKFPFAWQRWGSVAVKGFLLFQFLIFPVKRDWQGYQAAKVRAAGPFMAGFYDVRRYIVNHDTIAASGADTLRWRDVIIDNAGAGSVNTSDPVFWQRYHRGYFRYKSNPTSHTATVWKISTIPRDSTFLFSMRYEVPDTSTIRLHTVIRGDSVHVELVRVPRHFQLAERQFHWLSEYNR
jgi:hypothetical protein